MLRRITFCAVAVSSSLPTMSRKIYSPAATPSTAPQSSTDRSTKFGRKKRGNTFFCTKVLQVKVPVAGSIFFSKFEPKLRMGPSSPTTVA